MRVKWRDEKAGRVKGQEEELDPDSPAVRNWIEWGWLKALDSPLGSWFARRSDR